MKKQINVHHIPENNYREFEENCRKRKKKKRQQILSPEDLESESGQMLTKSNKKKKLKFISESDEMNVCGDVKLQENSDTTLCDDETASSSHESQIIPSSLDSELDHKPITITKRKKKKRKSHEKNLLNGRQFGTMKKYVKQEFHIDWQAVAEYLNSENNNNSNGPAENTESDNHTDEQSLISMPTRNMDTLYGHEIPMEDENDTSSEKLKGKRKHRKKHKNKIDEIKTDPYEIDQMCNYSDKKMDEEFVLKSEYLNMESLTDSIPKKKTKKRKTCNQEVIEDIPMFYNNSKLDQFLSSELLMGEAIPSSPKKQKKEKSREWDREYLSKSDISIPKTKKRRRLGDISVSSILRDYEQSIITSDAMKVKNLQSEPQEELPDLPQMENFESAIENPTPISQKYNRYYSIYKSDSDNPDEPTSPKKCVNGNDYTTCSDGVFGDKTVDRVRSETDTNPARANNCNSDSYYSDELRIPEKHVNTKLTDCLKTSLDDDFEDTEVDVEENCSILNQLAKIENNTKTRKSSVGASDIDSDYSDELTRPVDVSMKSSKKTLLDYFKSSKDKVSEDRNSTAETTQQILEISSHEIDNSPENINKKTKKSAVSVQGNILEDHRKNIDNKKRKKEKTEVKIISQNFTKNRDFSSSNISEKNVKKSILNGNENSRDDESDSELSRSKDKSNSSRRIVQKNNTTESQDINHSENDEFIRKTRSGGYTKNKSVLEPTDFDKEILKNLTIFLPFSIPPLHQQILYRSLPENVQHLSIKSGAFSKDEDNVILNNWKNFCDEHNLDVKPCAFFHLKVLTKIERVKFLQYISHGLNDRLPSRIHVRFKKIFENMSIRRGRFSKEEDKEILRYMKEYGDSDYPFVNLAKILNRNSTAVFKRYEILTNSNNHSKIIWTEDLCGKLIRRMMRVGKCERVEDLENLRLSTEQWNKLSKKMDNMPVKKLHRGWEITVYPRLFSKASILEVKNQIFHLLKERKESDWRKVDWKEIAKHFVGFTPQKVYNLFRTLVNFHVPKDKQTDLGECLRILNDFSIRRIKKFRRFVFKDGQLKYEKEESDEDEL